MLKAKKRSGEDNMFAILIALIITGIIYNFRNGISGNDFWWHVKVGEWITTNNSVPQTDIFSWYGIENNIPFIPHEWLSDVFFYKIHIIFGELGIFILSLFSAIAMTILIIMRNKAQINKNVLLSIVYLFPIIGVFPAFFYGRPHLISFFLLYATLVCLYKYKEDENSKLILFIPLISVVWSNAHGGSSNLPYILCLIFLFSGLFNFSIGKLTGEKLSKKQIKTLLMIAIISFLFLAINPSGLKMPLYPFLNIGDSLMQTYISEWSSPDAKDISQLFFFFLPLIIVGISLIIADKQVKLVDMFLFLFFTYLFFRSTRFCILFYIVSTFFTFDYFLPRSIKEATTRTNKIILNLFVIFFIIVNIFSLFNIVITTRDDQLVSQVIDSKFIDTIKDDSPDRLYSDYNFGGALIYNDIKTFVDERADVFSKHNLSDAWSLLYLNEVDDENAYGVFDVDELINKYDFDALFVQTNRSLATYLKSKPESYRVLLEDEDAIYFKRINDD